LLGIRARGLERLLHGGHGGGWVAAKAKRLRPPPVGHPLELWVCDGGSVREPLTGSHNVDADQNVAKLVAQ
jgi:hypothetical protein